LLFEAAQPVARPIHLKNMAVVQKSVEDCGGEGLVAGEQGRPFGDAFVRGDDRRGALVAKVHELEETVRVAPVEGLEAEFINNAVAG
jgi:hypothetical protein